MKDWIHERLIAQMLAADVYATARTIAEDRPVQSIATWMPVSLEMKADMGLPLTDAERAILAERQAALDAYRRSWRAKWHRLRGAWYTTEHRLRHALDALRGVECEREDW